MWWVIHRIALIAYKIRCTLSEWFQTNPAAFIIRLFVPILCLWGIVWCKHEKGPFCHYKIIFPVCLVASKISDCFSSKILYWFIYMNLLLCFNFIFCESLNGPVNVLGGSARLFVMKRLSIASHSTVMHYSWRIHKFFKIQNKRITNRQNSVKYLQRFEECRYSHISSPKKKNRTGTSKAYTHVKLPLTLALSRSNVFRIMAIMVTRPICFQLLRHFWAQMEEKQQQHHNHQNQNVVHGWFYFIFLLE